MAVSPELPAWAKTSIYLFQKIPWYLKPPVELFFASLEQLDVAGGVDGVAQVGVLPLGQVKLLRRARLHLLRHQRRALQLRHLQLANFEIINKL